MAISLSAPAVPESAGSASHAHHSARDGWWGLLYQGWMLATPHGQRLNLTATERACFLCLLSNPQRELTREALAHLLPQTSLRTINVSISRLRKKVQATGATLPLHTVHGMGYVFLGHLAGEGALS